MKEEIKKIIKDNHISYSAAMKIFSIGYSVGSIEEHNKCHDMFMANNFI